MQRQPPKYRSYAQLANDDVWIKHLKPDLIAILDEYKKDESTLPTSFATIKRDITRSTTNKIINQIIRLIERAETKVNQDYKSKQS